MGKSKIFIDTIKELRKELHLTQEDVAKASGVSVSFIKSIETGKANGTIETMNKIATALGVDVNKIYIDDYRDTKVIPIINSKGGCGKSTIAVNLSFELSRLKEGNEYNRVLLIDTDLQCNTSDTLDRMPLSTEKNAPPNPKSLYELLKPDAHKEGEFDFDYINTFIQPTDYENLDIIVSDFHMALIELELSFVTLREFVLKRIIDKIRDQHIYDYIIIDTNPMLGLLNRNVLLASDDVIIPIELNTYGIIGLHILVNFIYKNRIYNENLKILGILKSKVDQRYAITTRINDLLYKIVDENINILDVEIPTDSNIMQAQSERMPLYPYISKEKKTSRAVTEFKKLAKYVNDYKNQNI